MRKLHQNLGASVKARLLNLAKERNQPFDLLLTRYRLERLLYRLSSSKHRESFVLKGAMLMTSWMDDPHRPTRDLDLLGFGDSDPEAILGVFREICVPMRSRLRLPRMRPRSSSGIRSSKTSRSIPAALLKSLKT
jgi:hypothetical protein